MDGWMDGWKETLLSQKMLDFIQNVPFFMQLKCQTKLQVVASL